MSAKDEDSKRPLRDGIDDAKGQLADAAKSAGDAASAAVSRTREGIGQAREQGFAGTVEASPLAVLAGGAAIGLIIGALLPRSERETTLYGPLGRRLNLAARDAAGAARDAGREKLADMGFSRDHARDTVRELLDAALQAATSAGGAAVSSAKESSRDATA